MSDESIRSEPLIPFDDLFDSALGFFGAVLMYVFAWIVAAIVSRRNGVPFDRLLVASMTNVLINISEQSAMTMTIGSSPCVHSFDASGETEESILSAPQQ